MTNVNNGRTKRCSVQNDEPTLLILQQWGPYYQTKLGSGVNDRLREHLLS